MQKDKRAMVSQLQVVAFAIVGLVILAAIGLVVITKLGTSVAVCPSGYSTGTGGFNETLQSCMNNTGSVTNYSDPINGAWTALDYGATQIGSTGLLSWLPAVIALIIGVFFLAYFAGGKIKKEWLVS